MGIFDADLYGPSLPTMINPANNKLYADDKDPTMLAPIEFHGAKAMSYGFVGTNKSAVIRGPIASNLIN